MQIEIESHQIIESHKTMARNEKRKYNEHIFATVFMLLFVDWKTALNNDKKRLSKHVSYKMRLNSNFAQN